MLKKAIPVSRNSLYKIYKNKNMALESQADAHLCMPA